MNTGSPIRKQHHSRSTAPTVFSPPSCVSLPPQLTCVGARGESLPTPVGQPLTPETKGTAQQGPGAALSLRTRDEQRTN